MAEVTSATSAITSHLPLHLIKSQIIAPAPHRSTNGSPPASDFLLDFAGHSWIAYGASSLVVISHFPNPLVKAETEIGPVHRQVVELTRETDVHVSAVCWSPTTPSTGELAVALGDCIVLLSYNEDDMSSSSFCWSQTAILKQSVKVEAMQWTGSGDGIMSGGSKVLMWKRKEKTWEIAWSFEAKIPQVLVSATWSADGLSATAPCSEVQVNSSSLVNDARHCVFVYQFHGHSNYTQTELYHPMPVTMIQWRPSIGKPSSRHARHALRPVLLTCCLDGAVRLWGEIDDGRIRKTGKDNSDQRSTKLTFLVLAVIEVNQSLNGFLGSNLFVSWATEVEGVAVIDEEVCYYSCLDNLQHNLAGRSEWLIGLGPERMTTMWAIHCLDDFVPLRFPRVTLWKNQDFAGLEMEESQLLVHKVLIMRTQDSRPPAVCSFVHLLPCNSFSWTQLYTKVSANIEERSANDNHPQSSSTACAKGLLEVEGHRGKILQIAIHPFSFEVELAASLDENGTLLLWSFSTFFNSSIGLPMSTPSWKLSGKLSAIDPSPDYTCFNWAPTILGKGHILLMGHANGIDCFIVKISKDNDEKIPFHNLFSIPFRMESHEQGLSRVSSIPLPSNCSGNFVSSKFLLIALWSDSLVALSWEITIHSHDSQGSCSNKHWETFQRNFDDMKYDVSIDPCSSVFPVPHNDDKVTSSAVVCPSHMVSSVVQKLSPTNGIGNSYYAYHLVTGCFNGSIKFWRSMPIQSLTSNTNWALVGMLTSQLGPILAVSPSACGEKLATTSTTNHPTYSNKLCIWECVHVKNVGSFMLEDELSFDTEIVTFNWLRLGIGQLLLGICLRNEFRIYASRRRGGQGELKCEKPIEGNAWICIAINSDLPTISDFLWGPKGTTIIVHHEYLSFFSHFMSLSDSVGSNSNVLSYFFDNSKQDPVDVGGQYESQISINMNAQVDLKSILNAKSFQSMYSSGTIKSFWSMLEIAEVVGGSLPLFHPEALFINLCSGNWKRAYVALRHLVKHLASSSLSKQGQSAKAPSNIIPPVPLSDYLEGHFLPSSSDKSFQWSSSQLQTGLFDSVSISGYGALNTGLSTSSSSSEFDGFTEALERLYCYRHITEDEKMQGVALVELLHEVGNPNSTSVYGSLDEPGRRFWVAVRFQQLYFAKRCSRLPLVGELVVSSGLIAWAFHSDCHDNLFNAVLPTEPSWDEIRSMGVGFWYANVSQLRVKMEKLARQRYMKNKDPKACTLLYIALNRLQVLAGLFKISKDEKDKPLAGFLCRNFQEDKNKDAAIKNAYVLLGKHQLELAIAFFLLGGDASSAVTVCARNLGDEQLALVICRLIEGCGGPLEHNLILKSLLPSAVSKGDFWMASFLEWILGNYSQSFFRMLNVEVGTEVNISVLSSSHVAFLDPSIGQYCLMLATKTSMRNTVGEFNAATLCRWASLMNITSFSRCGLPIEAFEYFSSSISGSVNGNMMHSPTCDLPGETVKPIHENSSNWMSDEMSCHIVPQFKLHLAMQYVSNLLREHPSCIAIDRSSYGDIISQEPDDQEFEKLLKQFQDKLTAAIAYIQQKFTLVPLHLISMIVLSLHHNGLEFIGHHILQDYIPDFLLQEKCNGPDNHFLRSKLLKATDEMSCSYLKFVVASCKNCCRLTYLTQDSLSSDNRFCWMSAWVFSNQGILHMFRYLKVMFQLFLRSYSKDFLKLPLTIFRLFEYHVLFASVWFQKNVMAIIITVRPILLKVLRGIDPSVLKIEDLHKLTSDIKDVLDNNPRRVELGTHVENMEQKQEQHRAIPECKNWNVLTAAFWVHMTRFLEHQLNALFEDESCSSPCPPTLELDENNLQFPSILASRNLAEFLKLTCSDISSYCSKQFATYLFQEVNISNRTNYLYFEDNSSQPGADNSYQMNEYMELLEEDNMFRDFEKLWQVCTSPKISCGAFSQEYHNWLPYFKQKSSSAWSDAYASITKEFEPEETWDKEDRLESPSRASGSPLACLSPDDHPFKSSGGKDVYDSKKIMPFQNPKEIYRRNGELLEALCINSIDQCQAALSSNKKGIVFFNWEDGILDRYKNECIWGEADWPRNGWAGSDSVPVPTYVSPGVGLGSEKGSHLGLGGATIGAGTLVRSGTGLTGGGAFGMPGYAGVGASNLGWGIQESFDEFVDPPATVDNVRTTAFASHPSRPFFLVGSSNTHIYLWEFGKDIATATYGVLPAANVLPPYALASVSAVRFDHCGHRFVTASLDGTVCTWQLEVGGRNNVRPTESSVCFNNHTADVTYVTASGSIVAAAGHSSNGVNVVIWDTLAPPATSQAWIMCHEGGARSLSVFDNDIGSGSVSPLIVTGGKGGDVGLHDFRYIATGRTKKHKHLDAGEHNMNASSSVDMRGKTGDQNRNGMLWYIPKAHSGSVTKISTIPNSSFFLTGSKDGDVKLWDAKRAKLVFHWPKLHEKHTFLQPSNRGFGGVVRAAVMDMQVVSNGFLSCGGDGVVKSVRFQDKFSW